VELSLVWTIAQRELREALRNKWLLIFALGFALLAFGLARASLATAGYAGLGGFGRTAASLVNALLLFVPLLGLSVGAGAIAADRERGALLYLLAQPVSRGEVFWGKALGAAMACGASLLAGFGLAALGIAANGGADVGAFLRLTAFSALLALASLGLGFLISALTQKSSTASGAALLLWLALVFLGDLGLIGVTLALQPTAEGLLGALLVNPLQSFKLGAIFSLRSTLDTLGPVGQYATYRFGSELPCLLGGLLAGWAIVAFGLAFGLFKFRRDV
jgi:Cu-processing system permease protein